MKSKYLGALAVFLFAVAVVTGANQGVSLMQEVGVMYLGELRTATVTCTTTQTQIGQPGMRSVRIINTGATAVYIGDSDVDGTTAGKRGTSVCASGCDNTNTLDIDAKGMFCYAGSSQAIELVYGVQ